MFKIIVITEEINKLDFQIFRFYYICVNYFFLKYLLATYNL